MIRIRDLRVSFGDLVAVDGVDLDVHRGETFGLLGPNGAGKTTTIHCAIGVLAADSGTVDVGGRGPPTDPAVRRRIGIAPQELALYEELTGEENLRFFGRIQGLGGSVLRERAAWALEFAGLSSRRHDRVEHYSGGMKRRLNLACALVHQPDVLLLDEPTAGVDPQSRNRLFENVDLLREEGTTIVYTTHYMEEAARLCDRVAIVDHGRLLAVDAVDTLVAAHGGRAVIEVEFGGEVPEDAALPGPVEDGWLRFESDDPISDLARLRERELPFVSMHVRRPDLETVFLHLTGKHLRDE
jgi:ABC-2 type transport system ATP-binding protein